MLDDGRDLGETLSVEVPHAYWLMVAGRLPQAIAAFDHIVRLTDGDPQVGREGTGFSPLIWSEHMAAWTLAQAGRFDECWPRAERAIRLAREHGAQENLGFALGGLSSCAYHARGSARLPVTDLRRACLEAVEIAETLGNRYSQISASSALAIAFFVSGDYGASEERLTEALAQARGAGNALDCQGYWLAVFADAHLARGDAEVAIDKAREGIAVADAGGAWFQAAVARTVLVDALVRADAPEQAVAAVIAEARELVRQSGGNSLLPRLREAEARLAGRNDQPVLEVGLRAAEAMYRAMGAPDPADRLAAELLPEAQTYARKRANTTTPVTET
jgi:tetratricopeptide (TPR) repeat protein